MLLLYLSLKNIFLPGMPMIFHDVGMLRLDRKGFGGDLNSLFGFDSTCEECNFKTAILVTATVLKESDVFARRT